MRPLSSATILPALLAGLFTTACDVDRSQGPNEAEYGAVSFWKVTAHQINYSDKCSDSAAWRSVNESNSRLSGPDTFIMYLVSEDGSTARMQNCTSTDASTCKDADPIVDLAVSGNELSTTSAPTSTPISGNDCAVETVRTLKLTDGGPTLKMVVTDTLTLKGDETICKHAEDTFKAVSPNGKGYEGCEITFDVDADYTVSLKKDE